MARFGLAAVPAFCLPGSASPAGTSQGSFTVGIVIGKAKPHKPPKHRYTCGGGAVSLMRAGYGDLRRIEASGEVYWFAAERAGALFRVAVEIATGRIAAVIRA
jgi:hypothetical protein